MSAKGKQFPFWMTTRLVTLTTDARAILTSKKSNKGVMVRGKRQMCVSKFCSLKTQPLRVSGGLINAPMPQQLLPLDVLWTITNGKRSSGF